MAFGFAGAAAGANDALQELLTRKRAEFLQQQQLQMAQDAAQRQAAQFDAQMGLRQREFAADEEDRKGQRARQARLDEVADTERRAAKNKEGVRQIAIEGLRLRTADPRTAQLMAAAEGVDIPTDVLDPEREMRERKEILGLQHRQRLGEIAAQGDQARQTASTRTNAVTENQGAYSQERARRVVQSVDELVGKVNRWTTGAGSMLAAIPETDARNFRAELDTLKSNIAFNELTEMREASKTGGALGQVSNIELGLLQSALGAIDQGQSPENLKAQLEKIKESITRWHLAKAQASGGGRTTRIVNPGAVPDQTGAPQIAITSIQEIK